MEGVLTGCDQRQEWMLKWWWECYSRSNNYPVTFCDFGMSPPARAWCEKRGSIIPFHPENLPFEAYKESAQGAPWAEDIYYSHWEKRLVWFSKALVLPLSPYDHSIWLDIDCQVVKDLNPLFSRNNSSDGFAICYSPQDHMLEARIYKLLKPDVKRVQAGVFAFKKDSPIIAPWIANCIRDCNIEHGEETTLSNLLHQSDYDVTFLPDIFNWCTPEMKNSSAFIIHHTGNNNKYRLLCDLRL